MKLKRQVKIRDSRDRYFSVALSSLKHARTKQNYEWDISVEDVRELYEEQDGLCALSGVLMTTHRDGTGARETNASVDRISPDVGYRRNNIQLVCWAVNKMKGTLNQAEFWFWCENVSRRANANK